MAGMLILVVEDGLGQGERLSGALTEAGYERVRVVGADEAQQAVRDEAPDLATAHMVSMVSRSEGAVTAESWQAMPWEEHLALMEQLG